MTNLDKYPDTEEATQVFLELCKSKECYKICRQLNCKTAKQVVEKCISKWLSEEAKENKMNENEIKKLIENIDNHIDKDAIALTTEIHELIKNTIEYVNGVQGRIRAAEAYRKLITRELETCCDGLGTVLVSIVIARKNDEPVGDVFKKLTLAKLAEEINNFENDKGE